LPSSKDRSKEHVIHSSHVMRMFVLGHEIVRYHAQRRFERRSEDPLSPYSEEEQALVDFFTQIYSRLLDERWTGKMSLEELVLYSFRPFAYGFSDLPYGVSIKRSIPIGDRILLLPRMPRTAFEACELIDKVVKAEIERLKEELGPRRFRLEFEPGSIIPRRALRRLCEAVDSGYLPLFELTRRTREFYEEAAVPISMILGIFEQQGVNIGVDLRSPRMGPAEIRALGAGYCDYACYFYHAFVHELKALGELVAPVDAELFGEAMLKRYKKWKCSPTSARFRVLIPAQADETTISTILDYLEFHIGREEIIGNFHFTLSDLCVTPLLRVYAELKEGEWLNAMGDNIDIRTMDVLRWQNREVKFDFICTDCFIDLFTDDGEFSKRNVLISLINSLARGGQIVLTTRCGTQERPLSSKILLEDFNEKVDQYILALLDQLEEAPDEVSRIGTVNTLITLLFYRQLREVYPFSTEKSVERLLQEVNVELGETISWEVIRDPKREDKVAMVITKRGWVSRLAHVLLSALRSRLGH